MIAVSRLGKVVELSEQSGSKRDLWASLRLLLLGRDGVELRNELAEQAEERLKEAAGPLPAYTYGAWASLTEYWPTDGSWEPSPEIVRLLSERRYEESFEELQPSFQVHPLLSQRDSS